MPLNANKMNFYIGIGAFVIGVGVPIWVLFWKSLPQTVNVTALYVIFTVIGIMILMAFFIFVTRKGLLYKFLAIIFLGIILLVGYIFFINEHSVATLIKSLSAPVDFNIPSVQIANLLIVLVIVLPIMIWLLYFYWQKFFLTKKGVRESFHEPLWVYADFTNWIGCEQGPIMTSCS